VDTSGKQLKSGVFFGNGSEEHGMQEARIEKERYGDERRMGKMGGWVKKHWTGFSSSSSFCWFGDLLKTQCLNLGSRSTPTY
jgi:hypothetical protein